MAQAFKQYFLCALRQCWPSRGICVGRPLVPSANPALRSANLGLCARLRARIARPKVLNACSDRRNGSEVTIVVSVGAFDLQLPLKECILDATLEVGSRLGVLASGTVCG